MILRLLSVKMIFFPFFSLFYGLVDCIGSFSPRIKSAFVAQPWTLPFPLNISLWSPSGFSLTSEKGSDTKSVGSEGSQQQGDLEVLMSLGDYCRQC